MYSVKQFLLNEVQRNNEISFVDDFWTPEKETEIRAISIVEDIQECIKKHAISAKSLVKVFISSNSFPSSLQKLVALRDLVENGKLGGVFVALSANLTLEETMNEINVILKSSGVVSEVWTSSTVEEALNFTKSGINRVKSGSKIIINIIDQTLCGSNLNKKVKTTFVEEFSVKSSQTSPENLLISTGNNALKVSGVISCLKDLSVGLVSLNKLTDIQLEKILSSFDKTPKRIAVFSEDDWLFKRVSIAFAELQAENKFLETRIFNAKSNVFPKTKNLCLKIVKEVFKAEPNFKKFQKTEYSVEELIADKQKSESPLLKIDLVRQISGVSSKSFSFSRIQKVLGENLSLKTSNFEEKQKEFKKSCFFVGSVDTNSDFSFSIVNSDVIFADFETLVSSEKARVEVLFSLQRQSVIVINAKVSKKDVANLFENEGKDILNANEVKIVSFDASFLPKHQQIKALEAVLIEQIAGTNSGYNFHQGFAAFKEVFEVEFCEEDVKKCRIEIKFDEFGDSSNSLKVVAEKYLKITSLQNKEVAQSADEISWKSYKSALKTVFGEKVSIVDTFSSKKPLNHLLGKALASKKVQKKDWIVASSVSQTNLISSVHNFISNEKFNSNLLILVPTEEADDRQKKDIGLYCMHYGNCFVASVCLDQNRAQCLQALKDSTKFEGKCVILAGFEAKVSHSWPLYRWNPNETEENKFCLDSESVRQEIKSFLESEEHLTYLAKDNFKLLSSFNQSLSDKVLSKEKKLKTQFQKLQLSMTKTEPVEVESKSESKSESSQVSEDITLLILYGSDSGNAQTVAEKLAKKAQMANKSLLGKASSRFNRVSKIRCCEANEFSNIELLKEFDFEDPSLEDATILESNDEKIGESVFESDSETEEKSAPTPKASTNTTSKLVVLLVLSTAGQGEPTLNAKGFSDAVFATKSPSNALKNVNYAVFGLGDSHYWGKGTPESAKYFCKIAKDVDAKLEDLSAVKVCESKMGDDQDDDGFNTKLAEFESILWKNLNLDVPQVVGSDAPEIVDDDIKIKSNFLRGTIDEGLKDHTTLKMLPEDTKLTKFHGIYQQDLRSVREELDAKHVERAYSFMIRIGIPGGVCGVGQLLKMMDICEKHANKHLKLTTRQAFQIHGVVKRKLKKTMQEINRACMDTLAACGDVNRNVIANPYLHDSEANRIVNDLANKLSSHLKPKTSAYHEIWLDKKPLFSSKPNEEPIYGATYLPRKFKIAIADPPVNDVDVFAHCLGFIAILDSNGKLLGFNVSIGGGMGTTHNNEATYPKLAPLLGFVPLKNGEIGDYVKLAEAIVILQRDHGDRDNRKHARLKYTVEDYGLDFFQRRAQEISGVKLEPPRDFKFERNADVYGWKRSKLTNKWSCTLFIENGLLVDKEKTKYKSGLRHVAEFLQKSGSGDEENLTKVEGFPNFSMTANQNLVLGEISDELKPKVEEILRKYGLSNEQHSNLRLHSMACVALPTCGLAMAEAQTYLPDLISKIELLLEENGIGDSEIVIRMTGCPNGCARPYVAEIALIGKAPGQYNLYLGGGYAGNRINKLFKEGVNEAQILEILGGLFQRYANERQEDVSFGRRERFGDWCIRSKVIEPTLDGKYFWKTGESNLVHDTLQVYW